MKPHEIFGVAVRTVGVWVIAETIMGMTSVGSPLGFVGILMKVLLGCYVFNRANFIVDLAYPESTRFDPLAQ
jgi:hypothetical protein